MSARDNIAAHFTSDTLADGLLDAYRAEVFAEAAACVEDRACDADWQESRDFCAGLREAVEVLTKTGGEKCIPASNQPAEDGATHQHPRPCEYPEALPCACPRPGTLPEASFIRARKRSRIAAFFRCARYGRADAAERRYAA
jgi:hypothetical protein